MSDIMPGHPPMESYLRLIVDHAQEGFVNMAIDEFLLRQAIAKQDPRPLIRFYEFSKPTMTVGYGLWSKIAPQMKGGIETVRRITGGGIVRHGTDLVYGFISPLSLSPALRRPRESYQYIHETLRSVLNSFGLRTQLYGQTCGCPPTGTSKNSAKSGSFCFDSPVLFDVMLGERKVAGAGQKRTMGYLLQQGSIEWSIISEVEPGLTFSEFIRAFSSALAVGLDLSVKDFSFSAEEMMSLEAVAGRKEEVS